MIKFNKHFIHSLSTLNDLNLLNIYEKLKLINHIDLFVKIFINMFKIVNKSVVLQHKFRNMKNLQYD